MGKLRDARTTEERVMYLKAHGNKLKDKKAAEAELGALKLKPEEWFELYLHSTNKAEWRGRGGWPVVAIRKASEASIMRRKAFTVDELLNMYLRCKPMTTLRRWIFREICKRVKPSFEEWWRIHVLVQGRWSALCDELLADLKAKTHEFDSRTYLPRDDQLCKYALNKAKEYITQITDPDRCVEIYNSTIDGRTKQACVEQLCRLAKGKS